MYIPHYVPYIKSENKSNNIQHIETRQYTEIDNKIATTFSIFCVILGIVLIIVAIKELLRK